jgi:hypothetical protein
MTQQHGETDWRPSECKQMTQDNTVAGAKMISIRLTADQWRWVHGVLDGQLDAGACEGGNYAVERSALHAAAVKIMRAVKTLRPTNHPTDDLSEKTGSGT